MTPRHRLLEGPHIPEHRHRRQPPALEIRWEVTEFLEAIRGRARAASARWFCD